jgi:hypothetical protein
MTIRRGEEWGRSAEPPGDLVTVRTDLELRRLVDASRRTGRPIPPIELRGGDLARTLGVTGPAVTPPPPAARRWRAVPIDLGRVNVDGTEHWFASHLVARRLWWRGPIIATMNAQYIGGWDVAPRSHPNDGKLDVFEVAAELSIGDRWRARRRLPLGTHVPHPAITEHRMDRLHIESPRPLDLWLDGELVVRACEALVVIEPDAAEIYIGSVG